MARGGKGTEGKVMKGKKREKGGDWNLGGASLALTPLNIIVPIIAE